MKIRTTNKKRRHVSTARAIEFLETDGVERPEGLVKVAPGLLKRATIDRLLRSSGLAYARVTRPHAAVRFQPRRSNAVRSDERTSELPSLMRTSNAFFCLTQNTI